MGFPSSLPRARTTGAVPPLRWGILGTGWIADKFVQSVTAHSHQRMAAVGSRDRRKASQFAERHGIAVAHGSYQDLVADGNIDVIYIATPHNYHHEHALLALHAGKHVLVEKPMALDHAQSQEMVALARRQGLFFCEALWTYFLPKFDVFDQLLADGALGDISSVYTEYGEYLPPGHRIYDPALAGGPLLDLGTYPVSLLARLLGVPGRVAGYGQWHRGGIMAQLAVVLSAANGTIGTMSTTLHGFTPANAIITGSKAGIWFDTEFHLPGGFTLRKQDATELLQYREARGAHAEGIYHEAIEVARCIGKGLTETPKRPLDDTLASMATLDMIRQALSINFETAWR
ncbi:MAG: Gfo/Idh/MocA family protein [Devosia sp.]